MCGAGGEVAVRGRGEVMNIIGSVIAVLAIWFLHAIIQEIVNEENARRALIRKKMDLEDEE